MELTESFPDKVKVSGKVHKLNTDFRTGLKIMQAFEDSKLLSFEKQFIMCSLLYDSIPEDFEAACKAAIRFLDCGNPPREQQGGRVYSFTKDAELIYSAFLQTYGVDLKNSETLMHWWKFCAMFGDLSPDTSFDIIRSFRDRRKRGKLTKDEQIVWAENEAVLDLDYEEPDAETIAARENFDRLLRG